MNTPALTLLDQARKLKGMAENAYIELGRVLYQIETENAYKANFESFGAYCAEDLGLHSKSTVSKLLAVGRFVNENQLNNELLEGASYTTLYEAMNAYKGEDPQLILASAKTNSLSEIRATKQEKNPCPHSEVLPCCTSCWKVNP